MRYYHGSRNSNLTELTLQKSNDGYVYLTPDYGAAVLYGACPIRFWHWNTKENKLIIREVAKDGFKKLYKGVSFYIYSTDDVGEFEENNHLGRPAIRMKHDVKLKEKEFVPDAYEKIMELYKKGKIILWFWDKYTEEEKQKCVDGLRKTFTEDIMRDSKARFPEEYELLTNLRPELAVKESLSNK